MKPSEVREQRNVEHRTAGGMKTGEAVMAHTGNEEKTNEEEMIKGWWKKLEKR